MDIAQLKTIQKNFVKELQDANAGKKTSLPFIVHSLSSNPIVKEGEVFQVFVIGGTVGKVAILKKTKNGIKIIKKKEEKLEFKEEEDFLSFINKEFHPASPEGLALNLAYPIKPVFAKETAGAYIYKHFNLIIKEKKIDYPEISSTEELNEISLEQNYSSSESRAKSRESREVLKENSSRQAQTITKTNTTASQIARDLLRKSAQLVACQIAGIAQFKKHDIVFNMEGSLFRKGNRYKGTVEETVRQLVPKFKVKFVEIEDSAILGAAKLIA